MKMSMDATKTATPPSEADTLETMKESMRLLLRDWILHLRAQHLADGGNPMTHWDRMQAVLQSQARQATEVRQWMTRCLRHLQVQAPNNYLSLASEAVVMQMKSLPMAAPSERSAFVLTLVREEISYLMAMARTRAEERKAIREEALQMRKEAEDGTLY